MSASFRKVRIGFVNLTLSLIKGQKEARKLSREVVDHLERELNTQVIELAGPVSERSQAREAWAEFKKRDVDGVILFNGTFNTGELVAEIIRNLACPFALWGLEELTTETGDFSGSMVAVMAAGAIFKNLDKRFTFIYGAIEEEEAKNKARLFVDVVRAIAYLREATIAVIGMRPDGFQISNTDELAIKKFFGTEIVNLSTYTFSKVVNAIGAEEIDSDLQTQRRLFDISSKDRVHERGISRMYLALKKAIGERDIQAYAPECWPEFRDVEQTSFCPANSRLTAEGIMASCECDVDGALTMMLGYVLSGSSVFFADLVNFIKDNGTLLFWHCGNAPYDLANSKPLCEKVFESVSVSCVLRSGPVTVCRMNSIRGQFTLHLGTGQAVEAKPLLKGSNVFIRMDAGNSKFVESLLENGIPHHNVVVYGDIAHQLTEFAKLVGIPVIVCS